MNSNTVAAILDDYASAPIEERLRTMLGFLHKLTIEPEAMTASDVAQLRSVGLSDRAIEEAMYVCFAFNIMDRLADAFDFPMHDAAYRRRCAKFLRRFGYRMASVPG